MLFSEENLQLKYLKSLEVKLDQLNTMICKQSYDEISRIGHNMAGSGGSFGFPKISELGAAIENAGEVKDLDAVKKLQVRLYQEIKILQQKEL